MDRHFQVAPEAIEDVLALGGGEGLAERGEPERLASVFQRLEEVVSARRQGRVVLARAR